MLAGNPLKQIILMRRRWTITPRPIPELCNFRPTIDLFQTNIRRPANFILSDSPQLYNPKIQDPCRVVDNTMVYRKFFSGNWGI